MSFLGSFFKRSKKANAPEAGHKQTPGVSDKKGYFIGDIYEVYNELGHGGFGVVYLVHSREIGGVFALKTFKDEYLEDVATRELFYREANVWVDLGRHPFLVQAFLVDEVAGRLYIGMEYIAPNEQGLNSLEGYFKHQPPDLVQSLKWAIQICHGMEHAYSQNLRCHRDIKPENIMITVDKTVKITDFGLAGVLDALKAGSKAKLDTNWVKVGLSRSVFEGGGCGTPMYMPPEQFTDAATCDERSDIYSFGMVMYQMATGAKLPFHAPWPKDSSVEEQQRFWRQSYRLHCQAPVPKLTSPLYPLIQRCLEKDPNRRYQAFKELRADLEPLLKRQTYETVNQPELEELDVEEWINKGVSLYSLGRFAESVECYDMALVINPKYAKPWINKGNSLHRLGRSEEANQCYDKALEINPMEPLAWNNKGDSLNEMGQFNESIHCLDQALRINPQLVVTWNNKGISLDNLGRFNEAIECYDQALRINPQDDRALLNKTYSLFNLGRYDEAIAYCNQALKINPQYTEAWHNKGFTLGILGRFDEAINCFNQALRINPQYVDALDRKGFTLTRLGRFDEAIDCYNQTLRINPQYAEGWYSKGFELRNLSRFDEAIDCFDQVLRSNSQYVQVWYNKGACLFGLGHFNEAINCFDQVLKIFPHYTEAWVKKGLSVYGLDQYTQAIECYDKALEINSQHPDAWNNKGNSLYNLGRFNEACTCYRKFIEFAPSHHERYIKVAYKRLKELEKK